MKKTILFALACALAAEAPMGSTTDWWAFGGDALRDGWEKNEQRFTKDEVKDFRFLWQRKLDNSKAGAGALLPPVVLGRLIGYRGFKELAFVAGSGNSLWAIDSDLDRMYWEKHFEAGKVKHGCGESLTAVPALPGPFVFHAPVPGKPPSNTAARSRSVRPVFLLTGDGMLRLLNQEDGSELAPARAFLPAGVAAQPLNVMEDVVYTSTRAGCGQEAAVWFLDTTDPDAKPKSVKLGADVAGLAGVILDGEGRAFVQTDDGTLDPEGGKFGGSLVSLSKDLTVSQYFIMPQGPGRNISPAVFTWNGVETVVAAGKDGRLYVLKASDLGTADHHHYLSKSLVIPAMDGDKSKGLWGGLSSWEDTDGTRYILAPVWGPVSAEMQTAVPDAHVPNGSIVVFKMQDKDGIATLAPAWVSPDLESPTLPVIAKGVVFALANGRFSNSHKGLSPRKGSHATLFALDGATGKQIYSTGEQVTAAGNLAGMTIANGRIYFATVDGTLQVFGKYLER